jgi:hypothetical protein
MNWQPEIYESKNGSFAIRIPMPRHVQAHELKDDFLSRNAAEAWLFSGAGQAATKRVIGYYRNVKGTELHI